MSIFCPICKTEFKGEDRVILDEFNTLSHIQCNKEVPFPVKDYGLFEEIEETYEFFSKDEAKDE
ncbi:hypothetical protein [Cytobacillus kochii]|uniref:hypothetical protein n=1 Tax=Cytobacillus kochii TaxID=859143 RepID=UPI00402AA460